MQKGPATIILLHVLAPPAGARRETSRWPVKLCSSLHTIRTFAVSDPDDDMFLVRFRVGQRLKTLRSTLAVCPLGRSHKVLAC